MAKKETLGAYLNRNIEEKGSTLKKERKRGEKYKSIASAKKAGALYYTNKAGKIMAAVYAEDLKVRPAASELMNSGIKVTKLPPKLPPKTKRETPPRRPKTNMMDNPPPDLKRTAKLRTEKPVVKDKTVTAKVSRPPLKNKGGPVSKKPKGAYAAGGMPMVMKGGTKVPAFAADGKGKMNKGGMAKKKPAAKMMAGGMAKKKPAAKKMMGGGMAKSGYMYGGMAKKKK